MDRELAGLHNVLSGLTDLNLEKPVSEVIYLPMHVARKESSTTTKVRAVFNGSLPQRRSDPLFTPPSPMFCFASLYTALPSRLMSLVCTYRAVLLDTADKDLNRFLWRSSPSEPLHDYCMSRVIFGVAASSYASNMALKQNALDLAHQYPLAAKAVNLSFYVDDTLTGADSVEEAVALQQQLLELFDRGGFTLRKWNSMKSTSPPTHA